MLNLFCTSGTSPTLLYTETIRLASGSAAWPCLLEDLMPDSRRIEKILEKWRSCLDQDKSNIHTQQLFNKKILGINDLMVLTGFAKQTIYNMVAQKRIPYSKRGRKLFFSSVEILNWIQEGDSV